MLNLKYKSTRTRFTIIFVCFIGFPILLILTLALIFGRFYIRDTNRSNIKLLQENMATSLQTESKQLAMNLSNLLYMSDGELLTSTTIADTTDFNQRYTGQKELSRLASYSLGLNSKIVSLSFMFKSGRNVVYKTETTLSNEAIKTLPIYKEITDKQSLIAISAVNSSDYKMLYTGSRSNNLILLAALKLDKDIDRLGQIDFAYLFQISEVNDIIMKYDNAYENKNKNIGSWAIYNRDTKTILASSRIDKNLVKDFYNGTLSAKYTGIATSFTLSNENWDVITILNTSDLSKGFNYIFLILIIIMVIIFIFFSFFLRTLLKNIINPVTTISTALKEIENGDLDNHVEAQGYSELRLLAHSFNSMTRRIKALIDEYKTSEKLKGKSVEELWNNMIEEYVLPSDIRLIEERIFEEQGRIILIRLFLDNNDINLKEIYKNFNTFNEFAQSCIMANEKSSELFIYFKYSKEQQITLVNLVKSLQDSLLKSFKLKSSCIISDEISSYELGQKAILDLKLLSDILCLMSYQAIINLKQNDTIIPLVQDSSKYENLTSALFLYDEKVLVDEKEKILALLMKEDIAKAKNEAKKIIIAVVKKFNLKNLDFDLIFGYHINYQEQMDALSDSKAILLYINNFISSCQALILSKLDFSSLSTVAKVKKYISDNYHKSDLSLTDAAESVSLNEKYLSSLFAKESGETFLSYLTGFRIQNAKKLIKTTDLKMYEIATLIGYANPEHFNRTFKKIVGLTPNEYKKS